MRATITGVTAFVAGYFIGAVAAVAIAVLTVAGDVD